MRVLLFDTETNGLPLRRYAGPDDTRNWPLIVQIAWQLVEFPTESAAAAAAAAPVVLSTQCFIVRPDPATLWNEGSVVFHKISKETALSTGTPGDVVFAAFLRDATQASLLVAHNLAFDLPVVLCELIRHNLPVAALPEERYCTMNGTKALCKLPSQYGRPEDPYKYPKLSELYSFLFGASSEAMAFHAADVDVECLARCFRELVRRGDLSIAAWQARQRRVDRVAVVEGVPPVAPRNAASISTASSAC